MNQATSFFFYDLETSGLDPKTQRIMQFAGQRTTMDLEPVGEPINVLVKLPDDVVPSPGAALITGLTPQQTQADGLSEPDFLRLLFTDVFTPGTIVTGFNNVRFDDPYLRYTLYRNFYDPYAWAWQDGRSRWDLLDVVRMTRALRPEGIEWPIDANGDPVNKLEALAAANGLEHIKAHDAMSDVVALIAVARLIRQHQPKLYDYLLRLRAKREVETVVAAPAGEPFAYTSAMYGRSNQFTTAAVAVGAPAGRSGCYYVYDLRHDPTPYAGLSPDELRERLFTSGAELQRRGLERLPVKELNVTHCPAVAPLATLVPVAERLGIDLAAVRRHHTDLMAGDLPARIVAAYAGREAPAQGGDADGALYDGFLNDDDRAAADTVRAATADQLAGLQPAFADARLPELWLRYKGRHFPNTLSPEDHPRWEAYRRQRIESAIPEFVAEFNQLAAAPDITPAKQLVLEDLRLWVESIYPAGD